MSDYTPPLSDISFLLDHVTPIEGLTKLAPYAHVTTEAVAAYYQKHNAEYRALPTEPSEYDAAWAVIDQDIRAKLAPEMQTRHEAALKKYLETLRATAQITSAITER